MGGASSTVDDHDDGLVRFLDREVTFPGSEDLLRWDMDAVLAAHARLLALKRDPTPPHHALTYVLSKHEFFEVFNDFTRLVDGAFLSLPLRIYSVLDHNNNSRVFYPEIATMLALYSRGRMDAKIEFLFGLYDLNASGDMTVDEMIMLMTTIASSAFKLGITQRPPEMPEMEDVVREMFLRADTSNDGVIELAEFAAWARFHIRSKIFLDRFVSAAEADEDGGGRYSNYRTDGVQILEIDHVGTRAAVTTRRQHKRGPRPRNRLTAVASRSLMQTLALSTPFSLTELEALRHQFAEVSGEDCHLGEQAFVDIMVERFPELGRGSLLESIFHCFDENGDGQLNFKEFAVSLARLLRGSLAEKIQLVFSVLDVNGDGGVELPEVVSLINKSKADLEDIVAFAEEAIQACDVDGDGLITEDEFVFAMTTHPLLIETFQNSLKFAFDNVPVRELEAAGIGFNFEALVALVGDGRAEGEHNIPGGEFSRESFVTFVLDNFGGAERSDSELVALVERVFDSFDFDNSGSVEIREILAGIAHEFVESPEEQAQFYFSLYDADGSGALDKDEIVAVLLNLQHDFDSTARRCIEVLRQLDVNHDGSVSFEEFSTAMRRSPELLKCFGDIFGY